MQSLLKVNHNKSILPTRKESERLKAAATRHFESPNSVLREAKKLQSVLKARNSQSLLINYERRPSVTDEKSGDGYDLKDTSSSDSLKVEDTATTIADVTQDLFLGFFGLVHKDKSKNLVVTQTKRKRRTAAGQTNLYGDFSYFQAKRSYTKKNAVSSSVPESPCSSQDIGDGDENDRLSLTSTEKPSEPTSPEAPGSQDVAEKMETDADDAALQGIDTAQETTANLESTAASQEIGNFQDTATTPESTAASQETGNSQETSNTEESTASSQEIENFHESANTQASTAASLDIGTSQETTAAPQDIGTSQNTTSASQDTVTSQETPATSQDIGTSLLSQESTIAEGIRSSQQTPTTQESEISQTTGASPEVSTSQNTTTSQETVQESTISQEMSEASTISPAHTGDVAAAEGGDGTVNVCGIVGPNMSDVDQEKMTDSNLDGITEPLIQNSGEIRKSRTATSLGNILLAEAMETETSIGDPLLLHSKEERAECTTRLSNEDQIDEQDNPNEDGDHVRAEKEERMITEDYQANAPNVDPCEKEILLRYSPETDTVEVIPASGVRSKNDKPESSNLLRYRPESGTVEEVVPKGKAQPVNQKTGSPRLLNTSPKSSNKVVLPSEDQNIMTFDVDDDSNDSDPTSHPNIESQNPGSASPSKSNVCVVCFERGDAEHEKCSVCSEIYHKECAASCPSCHDTPSSISSIVGVDTASRLTSTDCSEVVKRYLGDTQGKRKVGHMGDSDNSRDVCDGNDFSDDQSSSNIVDPAEDKLHDDFDDSMDQDRVDLQDSMDLEGLNDSTGDQDTNDFTADDELNQREMLLEDDDSLVFSNSNLFEDESCNSSL
ncbi:hypothetical protein GE061_005926 [Apolygus lucorum]|uniref:Phorbol-ester/DAG-type domain-containing protein n=1 Tax=Apolygus lucorum TaxID=248454 RepID=A0A8S9WU73_APOLU|nr:hypothetical protein GE061_005926 [Apolygus lucorum]